MPAIQLDEKAVFNVARKIESPELRDEYLRQVTAGDANFTERISMLLREFEKRQSFLEQPAMHVDETLHTPESMTDEGTQIGPYRLREPIGEGGMGVVYVADQEQPVRRKVVLKLIKPGRDTKEVIARFAVERQALALMDHPNIARVLDAGTTVAGRPFFVMELVRRNLDHRRLRQSQTQHSRAASSVCHCLPGRPARPSEGDHSSGYQAIECSHHAARWSARGQGD